MQSKYSMTQDDQGRPPDDQWMTLTEATQRSGHTREALRQRVRRGTLPATKGNDGQLRIQARDLADLPPPDTTTDDHGQGNDATTEAALAILVATVADLRADLERTRTTLEVALADRLADHGRAERAEAQVKAEMACAAIAETRLATVEVALAEARLPWIVRVIRAVRLSN